MQTTVCYSIELEKSALQYLGHQLCVPAHLSHFKWLKFNKPHMQYIIRELRYTRCVKLASWLQG